MNSDQLSQPVVAGPPSQQQFPCKQCGATLHFAPGTSSLKCPYCGTLNEITQSLSPVAEQDFQSFLRQRAAEAEHQEQLTIHCDKCGAETTLKPNVTADRCPFCGSAVVAQQISKRRIKPQALLPFHITKDQAATSFRNWISSRWFAPNELKRRAQTAQISGVYIPAWTYDSDTHSDYVGERGDDYWDTESYTVTINGRSERRTRSVRKTRWRMVSGSVDNSFDDVLVLASNSLPRKYADALEPWDLANLTPYQDEFLSGFVAESYQVDLPQGFESAKQLMEPTVRQTVCSNIGGDHQRISALHTQYFNITFKHLLLPVWISAYLYAGQTYRFLVNARTGEVQGERPYSWIKITLAVLAGLIVIAIILLLISQNR